MDEQRLPRSTRALGIVLSCILLWAMITATIAALID
jgi:hypothetical protein